MDKVNRQKVTMYYISHNQIHIDKCSSNVKQFKRFYTEREQRGPDAQSAMSNIVALYLC